MFPVDEITETALTKKFGKLPLDNSGKPRLGFDDVCPWDEEGKDGMGGHNDLDVFCLGDPNPKTNLTI
jgi:hypothetical protein